MLLVVHVIAGATVGAGISDPFIAAPLAFATHFGLDALPHWNFPVPKQRTLRSFWVSFGPDMVLSIVVALAAVLWFHQFWANVLWGIGWACFPDFLTLYIRKKPWSIWLRGYYRFHYYVQWEVARAPGLAVQAFFTAIMGLVLASLH